METPPASGLGGDYDAESLTRPDLRALGSRRRSQVHSQRRRAAPYSERRSHTAKCRLPSSGKPVIGCSRPVNRSYWSRYATSSGQMPNRCTSECVRSTQRLRKRGLAQENPSGDHPPGASARSERPPERGLNQQGGHPIQGLRSHHQPGNGLDRFLRLRKVQLSQVDDAAIVQV